MSDSSVYLGNKLLNWLKGTAFGTAPTNVFCSLWNGDPDSGGTQVTGTSGLSTQTITFGAIASRAMSNSADLVFGTTSGSVTVSFVVIADNATYASGNQICKKNVSTTSIASATIVKIVAGNLTLSY
jgi:hypothetical protein